MRALLFALGLATALVGCESQRHGKPCVGVVDQKDPATKYQLSARNVVVGVIFSESIVVPAVIILTELECPIQ